MLHIIWYAYDEIRDLNKILAYIILEYFFNSSKTPDRAIIWKTNVAPAHQIIIYGSHWKILV